MKHLKLFIYTLLILGITLLLFYVQRSPVILISTNGFINYQANGLALALVTIGLTAIFADRQRLSLLNTNRKGTLNPLPIIGNNAPSRWEDDGWSYALIMALIMGVVTFIATFRRGFSFSPLTVALVFPLAASNAFVEEIIFRFSYVTMGLNEGSPRYALFMSTLVFGIIHYWGAMPNGLLGSVMSAFIGFFLAKSILETKGFYWAFMIHFVLDIVIMMLTFNTL